MATNTPHGSYTVTDINKHGNRTYNTHRHKLLKMVYMYNTDSLYLHTCFYLWDI